MYCSYPGLHSRHTGYKRQSGLTSGRTRWLNLNESRETWSLADCHMLYTCIYLYIRYVYKEYVNTAIYVCLNKIGNEDKCKSFKTYMNICRLFFFKKYFRQCGAKVRWIHSCRLRLSCVSSHYWQTRVSNGRGIRRMCIIISVTHITGLSGHIMFPK